jgi:predicted nuclease of predicted toxin-antitoxin system
MTDEQLFVSIYTDEDVTDRLAELLREHGFIAATTAEWGMTGATDEEQLRIATERGHAVLTFNRDDFVALARRWFEQDREHAGIIISAQLGRRNLGELTRMALKFLDSVPAEEMWNTVRQLQSYR